MCYQTCRIQEMVDCSVLPDLQRVHGIGHKHTWWSKALTNRGLHFILFYIGGGGVGGFVCLFVSGCFVFWGEGCVCVLFLYFYLFIFERGVYNLVVLRCVEFMDGYLHTVVVKRKDTHISV